MASSSSSSPRLYVGNLARGVDENELWRMFGPYGPSSVCLKFGYAFIEFSSRRNCEKALHDLDDTRVGDSRIRVEKAKSRDRNRLRRQMKSKYKLNVRNLSSRLNWKDLKNFFIYRHVDVIHADCNDVYIGEGEVYFDNREDMNYAYRKLDGELLNGRSMKLIKPRDDRDYSRSRSRSPVRRKTRGSVAERRHRSYSSDEGDDDSRYSHKRGRRYSRSSVASSYSRSDSRAGSRHYSSESYVSQSSADDNSAKVNNHKGNSSKCHNEEDEAGYSPHRNDSHSYNEDRGNNSMSSRGKSDDAESCHSTQRNSPHSYNRNYDHNKSQKNDFKNSYHLKKRNQSHRMHHLLDKYKFCLSNLDSTCTSALFLDQICSRLV